MERTMSEPTPSQLLSERISDRLLSQHRGDPAKREAWFNCAEIAIRAVLRAGLAGNVQCQQAAKEMEPHLAILLK